MLKDVVGRTPPVTTVHSAEEGLLVSLDRNGAVDFPYIALLYGKDEDRVIDGAGRPHLPRPEPRLADGRRVSFGERSGEARRGRAAGPSRRERRGPSAVQPEDVLPGDIDANLGAPWIPESDIQAFAAELFGVPPRPSLSDI